MLRALPVHLIAMASLIAWAIFLPMLIGPSLPDRNRNLVYGLTALYVLAWLTLLSVSVLRRGSEPEVLASQAGNRLVIWGGNTVIIIGFWLAVPYADEAVRMLCVAGAFATVATEVLGAIERPPTRRRIVVSPLALPISTALYFVVHWDRFSLIVAPFSIAYAINVMTLRAVVQRAVDRTHDARQAAEAALVQVAAERDAKTRFLASASHDLGQPLQAARLFFDQAMRAPDAARREAAAGRVTWAFDATEQLLRQMLDHLRLESGVVEPHLSQLALGPLIARVAEMHEPAARLAGVTLLALPSRVRATADVALLERALGNLVSNGIRHAKARRLLIGARRRAGRVRLWVINDGVGISPADAPQLFEDFVQGSDHGDEIRGGFGLGLASARRMAGLMDGAVGLDPKWRQGSAFWLELNVTEALAPG